MSCSDDPTSLLVDISGTLMPVTASVMMPTGTSGIIAAGVGADGVVRFANIDTNSALKVTGSVAVATLGTTTVMGSVSVYTQGAQNVSGTISTKGTIQSGSTAQDPPVFVAGADSNKIIRGILTDVSGAVSITSTGSLPVSNTVPGREIIVLNNVTVVEGTTTSSIYTGLYGDVALYIQAGTPSGPTPTLSCFIRQVDPVFGNFISDSVGCELTDAGSAEDIIKLTLTGRVQVHLDASAGSSWPNVYVVLTQLSERTSVSRQGVIIPNGFNYSVTVTGGTDADTGVVYGGVMKDVSGGSRFDVHAPGVVLLEDDNISGVGKALGVAANPMKAVASVYTQGAQLVSGTVTVITTGSLKTYDTGTQSVSGSVSVYTQGAQNVSGTISAKGTIQSGSTAQDPPVFVAGTDSNNVVRGLLTDTSGRQLVVGPVQSGSTAQGSPVFIAGADSNKIIRGVLTDASGTVATNAGYLDGLNSTSTPLASGGFYLGTYVSTVGYDVLFVRVDSNVGSATNGVQILWSYDGVATPWADTEQAFTYPSNLPVTYQFRIRAPFYRIQYTNAAVAQTRFTLASTLKAAAPDPTVVSGQRLDAAALEIPRPALVAGSDGTNARIILTDTSGRIINVGTVATGSTAQGNPQLIAGSDSNKVVRGVLTDTGGAVVVTSTGSLPTVNMPISTTATLSNVASSASSVTLLASNTLRRGATIYNDSTQVCFVKFGTTASNTSFTVRLASQDYYEVPFGYTGRIDGIWASANGNARVTEIT